MTAKEKAEDILDKCYGVEVESVYFGVNHYLAKKFALIVVDEIIENQENVIAKIEYKLLLKDIKIITFSNYWNEVKQEIEKL